MIHSRVPYNVRKIKVYFKHVCLLQFVLMMCKLSDPESGMVEQHVVLAPNTPGSKGQSWAWVPLCVEFCTYIFGFPLSCLVYLHWPKTCGLVMLNCPWVWVRVWSSSHNPEDKAVTSDEWILHSDYMLHTCRYVYIIYIIMLFSCVFHIIYFSQ